MKNPFKKAGRVQFRSLEDAQKEVERLQEQLQEASASIRALQEEMQGVMKTAGIVRFNPFREIGGDQSFTISLLDSNGNGAVVTSHYGRDSNRVYAKPISQGMSKYSLSEEEKKLIAQSMKTNGSNNTSKNSNEHPRGKQTEE